ncbi:Uncharacterised protein [Enterobacter asburiae]|nr:Uncharacterised protein [Enterobacter asburiae]CZY39946.1 Uncharacterised protein [Enterobacter cloacae]SAB10464.1 Uncharacterised protein [Enterobacter asburiae]SAF27969.1 Uncharacterised protein [Enterobacter asburiae]SAG03038.1 Uncharacterised protein [Enterobacter asburiae]
MKVSTVRADRLNPDVCHLLNRTGMVFRRRLLQARLLLRIGPQPRFLSCRRGSPHAASDVPARRTETPRFRQTMLVAIPVTPMRRLRLQSHCKQIRISCCYLLFVKFFSQSLRLQWVGNDFTPRQQPSVFLFEPGQAHRANPDFVLCVCHVTHRQKGMSSSNSGTCGPLFCCKRDCGAPPV